MNMKSRLVVATLICIVLASMPLIANAFESYLRSLQTTPSVSVGTVSTTTSATMTTPLSAQLAEKHVIALGCGESHTGADTLVVCPIKVYTDEPGSEVTINATVYFRHAQPCPYSDWKIYVRNLENSELVYESETQISGGSAIKSFTVKILGNGSLEVVFKYGTGCPYGTEEVVKVEFYVVRCSTSLEEVGNETEAQSPIPTAVPQVTELQGVVESIDLGDKTITVNGTTVAVRGKWNCSGSELKWRDLLSMLSPGTKIYIIAEPSESGVLSALEIRFEGYVCTKTG